MKLAGSDVPILFKMSSWLSRYRWISKRYPVSEVMGAMGQIITDVRRANLSGLSGVQRARVEEAYKT